MTIASGGTPSGIEKTIVAEDTDSCRASLSYLFFGGASGTPLPLLDGFKVATHTKGNAEGVKKERAAIRVIPKAKFTPIATTRELVAIIFGLSKRASPSDINYLERDGCESEV